MSEDNTKDVVVDEAPKAGKAKSKAAAKVQDKRVTIVIDEEEGKPNYEVVGVNGKVYQIQRGVPVSVPASVVHVLENAIASRLVPVARPEGKVEMVLRDYHAVPFRVTREQPAEVAL